MSAELTPDIERVLATAESDLRLAVDELCPHGPEEHAEGTCETCDTAFAVDSEIQEAFQTLAQALAPVLAAAVRDAKAEVLRGLAVERIDPNDSTTAYRFYGEQRRWLRDRADRVAEPQHEAATSGKESED